MGSFSDWSSQDIFAFEGSGFLSEERNGEQNSRLEGLFNQSRQNRLSSIGQLDEEEEEEANQQQPLSLTESLRSLDLGLEQLTPNNDTVVRSLGTSNNSPSFSRHSSKLSPTPIGPGSANSGPNSTATPLHMFDLFQSNNPFALNNSPTNSSATSPSNSNGGPSVYFPSTSPNSGTAFKANAFTAHSPSNSPRMNQNSSLPTGLGFGGFSFSGSTSPQQTRLLQQQTQQQNQQTHPNSPTSNRISSNGSPNFSSNMNYLNPVTVNSTNGNLNSNANWNISDEIGNDDIFQFEETNETQNSERSGSPSSESSISQFEGGIWNPAPSIEHPLGEHPSRTLFVRNINSNVEDEELQSLFEQYGPIRNMYTQCKHRGFVMISYYDIRHAKNAMRYLQGKVIRRRKLDIHYSIPKDNPSEKDQNQGTLVIFNLDPSTNNEELKQIFGACGEIKEIRETPNKKYHKFIEFYDVRDAEKAMKFLNKTDIKGKKIKIEHSRPGGARRTQGPPENNPNFTNPQPNSLTSTHHSSSNDPDSIDFIDSSMLTAYSPSTNSYPPLQQVLPKYSSTNKDVSDDDDFFLQENSSKEMDLLGPSLSLSPSRSPPPPSFSHVLQQMEHRPRSRSISSVQQSAVGSNSVWNTDGQVSRSFSPTFEIGNKKTSQQAAFSPPTFSDFTDQRATSVGSPSDTRKNRAHSIEEDKSKYSLDLDRVRNFDDKRTTLMVKNIPNKYSQKMLLSTVDERHKGTYDFFYLPIDFKNKCNVGYAFINFISAEHIIPFYQEFDSKKWEKFNSEKVCEITYARIQGKNSLITHFQNSSLMCEDRRCRPIIFHSEGPNIGEQEPFPVGAPRRNRSFSRENNNRSTTGTPPNQ